MLTMQRRDLEARIGSVQDALGPRPSVLESGPERGCRIVTLRSGTGLEATVNVDRGMDVRDAWWKGRPLAFVSSSGDAHPAAYEPWGTAWLRTWPGGLVTTCGLRNVGSPSESEGEHLGQHGRAGQLAARDVGMAAAWEDDQFVVTVSGTMREARPLAEHLEMRRTWRLVAGTSRLELQDEIRNAGFRPEPLLVLYHINLGWPLLDEDASVEIPGNFEVHSGGIGDAEDGWRRLHPPEPVFPEQVIFHDVPAEPDGRARARLVNPSLEGGTTFELSWHPEQLPHFTQWRSLAAGTYALGFEPANCRPLGRASELEAGRGNTLEPGESKTIELSLTVAV